MIKFLLRHKVSILIAIPILLTFFVIVLWANGIPINHRLDEWIMGVLVVVSICLGSLGKLEAYRRIDEENGRGDKWKRPKD